MDDTTAAAWAEQQFASVNLRHRRRTRRLVRSAAAIAARPEQPFNQIFDWNDLRAFYNLCDQDAATLPALQAPHWHQTRQAMGQHPLVLVLHDTTELDFTDHPALQGAGPIGDGRGRGFLQHNSLAVLPQPRQVLGLAYQQWRVRQPAPAREHTQKRKRRRRESALWLEGITAAGRPPAGSCWVDVGDRGSDLYEAMVAAQAVGHAFLFRVTQNRQVWASAAAGTPLIGLRDYAGSLPSQGRDRVDIPGRGGRAARTATVQMAAAPVWIPAPQGTRQRWSQPVVAAWVIRIWEADAPPGVEPLEWLLVCSVATQTPEELKTRRDWYSCRWLVEVFHHIEKNGCREEARRFETAARLEACLAILSVVAVRVFQLRTALTAQPEAPAEQVATAEEIQVLRAYHQQEARPLTVRDFVRGVAKLGGFLGRKHDGEPGVLTLWRGYQRLQDLLHGYQLQTSSAPTNRRVIGNR
jgi:hypothetical protein